MNNRYNTKQNQKQTRLIIGFAGVHPPGGLVVWPDGHTTRLGEHCSGDNSQTAWPANRRAFVAWPEKYPALLRA